MAQRENRREQTEYKERTREVKREVAKAKHNEYELYDKLDTKE